MDIRRLHAQALSDFRLLNLDDVFKVQSSVQVQEDPEHFVTNIPSSCEFFKKVLVDLHPTDSER
jgi:hypothetical protein